VAHDDDVAIEVDALGLSGEVAKDVVAEGLRLIGTAGEEHFDDVICPFVELVHAAGAEFLLMRFGPTHAPERREVLRFLRLLGELANDLGLEFLTLGAAKSKQPSAVESLHVR